MRLCSLVPVCAMTLGLIASTSLTVSAMTFKPAEGRMWDVCVFHHDGTYHLGYTANSQGVPTGFGVATSSDGVHWKDRGIVRKETGSGFIWKSPDFQQDGKFQYNTVVFSYPGPGQRIGFLESSDLFDGDAHFARFFSSPDGMLVVHFSLAKEQDTLCYMAPMKRAVVDQEGILRLAYWKGNDKLKGEAVAVKTPLLDGPPALLEPRFDVERGFILEGTIRLPDKESAQLPGVYLESGEQRPTLVRMLPNGASQIGTVKPDGSDFQPRAAEAVWGGLAEIDRQISFGPTARFRILVRHGMLEFYLDDVLFHIRSLTQPATGKIGIVGAPGSISDLQAWQMDLP
ncbi:MAG: hypothetical protein NTW21_25275 [Verrucomicrobia bacterium]|nr:hypothetical protein [Verrucomicrobiota bacterium]